MKFCHVLETTSARWAEYRTLFLFYKFMKKQLKGLAGPGDDATEPAARAAEDAFVATLCHQISKLNEFRMERQASSVTTLATLQEAVRAGGSNEERYGAYQALVNFHGETLLLMHWSILGYTAIVKLLKKHHKRTGILIQAPHLRQLLSQPSWSTEIITGLVQQAEASITQVQVELFGDHSGEVLGPLGHPMSSSSSEISAEKQVLMDALVTLANGEDSGDDSTGIHDDTVSEAGDGEGTAATSGCNSKANSVCHAGSTSAASPTSAVAGPSGAWPGSVEAPPGEEGPGHPSGRLSDQNIGSHNGESFVNVPLLQQMQTALRTWEYLHTNASTPSTVLRGARDET